LAQHHGSVPGVHGSVAIRADAQNGKATAFKTEVGQTNLAGIENNPGHLKIRKKSYARGNFQTP
jgi:hypothetical protein